MKLLVLGGKGMAGHMIVDYFQRKDGWDVSYTCRDSNSGGIYLDVLIPSQVEELIDQMKPDIVINAIGILNQHAERNKTEAFQVNSLLPHQLAKLTKRYGGKLVHISTDCVFSGEKGDYTEFDSKDGTSVYAKTKAMGEVNDDSALTIRTSIVGPELKKDGIGLLLWFMQQKGEIKGYKNMMWNGVTTLELAKAIDCLLLNNVTGLYHLCVGEKVSKYELLHLFKNAFNKDDVRITPDEEVVLDRTIVNTRKDFIYTPPNYESMLKELKDWMEDE
ncbi:dTDP-4-dehydrorhamnose reductase family protein [Alkalihalobacillus sp. CinArs1]|uniref:dTDP-4-dehydrorhamnose reductase family protein n=1 Tax=Alkalihalobacillus sp. CinArs1 TaxID=2995314 RepID=UPI0022DDAC32|nr:SDR family oxidoreductase [Alkalihalobacillus sp. CinArs1]